MSREKSIPGFHAVLLAGGSGTRFWPLSRRRRPKQFLALGGSRSLIRATWDRVRALAPPSRIWTVAPADLVKDVAEAVPGLRPDRLVVEPSPRDTAPAIALAAAAVHRVHPTGVMGVFPTDHVVRDVAAFRRTVEVGARAAANGKLVCVGVTPDRPATGFGYLECSEPPRPAAATPVERFVEKPPLDRARRFVRSGRFLWNGGMFLWRADRFRDELERTAPAILRAVDRHLAGKKGAWARATRMSVDYAVMEKATDVAVVPLDAGWDDVGSWDAAARLRVAEESGHVLVDSTGSTVFGDERTVAVVGVPNVVVVDTPDALLVVARDRAEDVKQVVSELKRNRRNRLL